MQQSKLESLKQYSGRYNARDNSPYSPLGISYIQMWQEFMGMVLQTRFIAKLTFSKACKGQKLDIKYIAMVSEQTGVDY